MARPGDLLIGRYRILERLGSGGMATVHRARDERLERDVAVKVLLPNLADDPDTAARFEREARSLAGAAHPGVVAVFDVDAGDPATDREPFFVMELCPGGSLADRLAGGRRMAPGDLVPILVQVADGLADLHRRGIVHRDIKPHNILFATDRPKLADFGLARSDDGTASNELTSPGTAIGTLAYLAPEILAGERATAAADLYGLGVVAFAALTGVSPRPAGSTAELVTASQIPAQPVSAVVPDLGPAFDEPIAAALAVRPENRPDALTFASSLTAALGRWSRGGGPARQAAAAPVPDGPAEPGGRDEEETTVLAMPLAATAAIPTTDPGAQRDVSRADGGETRAARSWVGPLVLGAVVLAAIAVLAAVNGRAPSAGAGAAPSLRPSAASAVVPGSPSVAPSPARASAHPGVDPAFAALDAVDAAIDAARGGPDGLKGKEANDLATRAAAVRQALEAGDRAGAREAAGKLDRRIDEVVKGLSDDRAARLRRASADLLRALGV